MGGSARQKKFRIRTLLLVVLAEALLIAGLDVSPAYADECPAGGEHTYSAAITLYPTEDQDGIRKYTCTKCGFSFDLPIPATGHQWGPWIVDLAPTCSHEGHRYRICTRYPESPHYEEEILSQLSPTGSHSHVLSEEVHATCTAPGYRLYTCQYCGDVLREGFAALGHVWGPWVVESEPTTTEEGKRQRTCLHDPSHVEYEMIPRLDVGYASQAAAHPASAGPGQPDLHFRFGAIDAAFLAMDAVLLLIVAILITPFVARARWAKKRRAMAREKRSAQQPESEINQSLWWV